MPTVAQCSKCQRAYTVIGPHSSSMMTVWICPRCKRERSLPDEAAPEHLPLASSPPGMPRPR